MASLRPLTPALCWALMIWACLARETPERSTPFLPADQLSSALLNLQKERVGITLSEETEYPALGNQQERDLESLKSSKNPEMDRKLAGSAPSGTDVSKKRGDSRTETLVPKEPVPKDPTKKTSSSDITPKVNVSSDVPGENSSNPDAEMDEQKTKNMPMNMPSGLTGNQINPPPPEKLSKDSEPLPDGPNNKVEKGGQNLDTKQGKDCDGNHGCEAGKVSACLGTSESGTQELSLLVQNIGDKTVIVEVIFPAFLRVEPANLTLEKGKKQLAFIAVVDYKVALQINATNITISTGYGDCPIEVPSKYLQNVTQQSFFQGLPYLSMITPMVLVSVLLFIFVAVAGIWLCCRYRRKRRHADDFKYQELEMGLPGVDVAKYQQKKASKLDEEHTDGWDEVWEDGWEEADTARSSSLLIENLSSKGLATRRSNKDGWDSSWDD